MTQLQDPLQDPPALALCQGSSSTINSVPIIQGVYVDPLEPTPYFQINIKERLVNYVP